MRYRADGPDPWDVEPGPVPDDTNAFADDLAGDRYRGRRRRPRSARRAARWGTVAVVLAVGTVLVGSGVLARSLSGPATVPVLPPSPAPTIAPPPQPTAGHPGGDRDGAISGVGPVRSPAVTQPAEPSPEPTGPATSSPDPPLPDACRVEVDLVRWPGGFRATYTLTNDGEPWDGWTVRFRVAREVAHEHGWDAFFRQRGRRITATNLPWNGSVGTGESVVFGHQGSRAGSVSPSGFEVDGVACTTP